MTIPFDRDLITDQMNTLGLSERRIVQQTGIPYYTFRKARQGGTFEPTMTLRQLNDLANILGLTLSELLHTNNDHNTDTTTQPTTQSVTHDVTTLIPLLIDLPKMVPINHIAQSLEWKRHRLNTALEAIPHALHGTGLRLHTNNERIKILPTNATNKHHKRALGKTRTLGLGLNTTDATTLTRIINGENVLDRFASNPTRVSVGTLKNMGCITTNQQAVFEPTDQLRLALPDL